MEGVRDIEIGRGGGAAKDPCRFSAANNRYAVCKVGLYCYCSRICLRLTMSVLFPLHVARTK